MIRRLISLGWLLYASLNSANAAQPAYPELLLDDIKQVISAPAHWDDATWRQAGWIGLGVLGTAIIVDKPLQNEMRRHAPNNNGLVLQVERFGAQYAALVVGGFYAAGLAGNQTADAVAQDGFAASLIASGIISPALKFGIGRSRPRANLGNAHFQPGSDTNASFPSGHTTEAFALASVIAEHYEETWVQAGAYSVAGLVGLARSYHDAHFASDIVAGAVIGTWVGKSVVEHNRTAGKLSLHPDLAPGRTGLRLAGNF